MALYYKKNVDEPKMGNTFNFGAAKQVNSFLRPTSWKQYKTLHIINKEYLAT